MEKRIYTGKDADTREEVTVVIPVFNREDIVVETLESVKAAPIVRSGLYS